MQPRAAIIGAVAGAALRGLLLARSAQAKPSVCVSYHISINGDGQASGVCPPPEDSGETP